MSSDDIKSDRQYTDDHEWAKASDGHVTVGITAYAVDQLGDITLVNLDVSEGDTIEQGKAFGTVESVKTLADLFAPISGTVVSINEQLEDEPELVNDACYEGGWLITIAPTDATQLDGLLDAEAYGKLLDTAAH